MAWFWIRPGLTRVAVRIGPLVFKAPRHKVGIVCNLTEWYLSEIHPGERHLVPTLATLFGWLNVQPYAGRTLRADEVTDAMLRGGDDLGILDCGAGNIAADYRGSWAIVDYGFSPMMCFSWHGRGPCRYAPARGPYEGAAR